MTRNFGNLSYTTSYHSYEEAIAFMLLFQFDHKVLYRKDYKKEDWSRYVRENLFYVMSCFSVTGYMGPLQDVLYNKNHILHRFVIRDAKWECARKQYRNPGRLASHFESDVLRYINSNSFRLIFDGVWCDPTSP